MRENGNCLDYNAVQIKRSQLTWKQYIKQFECHVSTKISTVILSVTDCKVDFW